MDDSKPDYIDEHQEWQRSQFILGHYTQGKVPHYLKWPGSFLNLALIFIFADIFYIGNIIYFILEFEKSENQTLSILNILFLVGITALYIVVVISLFKKYKKLKNEKQPGTRS